MKKLYVALLILTLFTTSCNNREEREKALKDLESSQKALVDATNEISNLENLLTKNISELEVAKDDISQAKEFRLLRTETEREQHIRSATEYKLKVEKNIETIKSNIEYFKDSVFRTEMNINRLKEFLKN